METKDDHSLKAAQEIMKLTRQGEFDDQLRAKIQVEINKVLEIYSDRIENAMQAMSETHQSWESRCHAIMSALGVDYGRMNEPSSDSDQLSPAVEYINTHQGPLFTAMVSLRNIATNEGATYWQHEINALVSVIREIKVNQNG